MDDKDKNIEKNDAQSVTNYVGTSEGGKVAETTKQPRISEAEAKMLLAEETRKTHQKLQEADRKNKKMLAIVIAVAVAIVAVGIGIAVILGGKKDDEPQDTDQNDQSQVEDKKPEDQPDDEPEEALTEVGLNEEIVHQLYDVFGILTSVDMIGFYEDPTAYSGFLSNKYVSGVAFGNIERTECKMPKTTENLTKRYADQNNTDLSTTDLEVAYDMGCYSGSDLRNKAQEIFGKTVSLEGMEFPILGWAYSNEYDEVYSVPGMGGDGFGPGKGYIRGLYKAEQDEDENLYLYEVMAEVAGPGLICAKTGKYCEDEYEVTLENVAAHKEDFNQYKWYFTKQADGNYIFEKIEKIKD